MDKYKDYENVIEKRRVPAIESYPTKMMFSFIEKGVIVPQSRKDLLHIAC